MAKNAIMAIMTTVDEKIMAMLATVRELRKYVKNSKKSTSHISGDAVFDFVAIHSNLSQKELISSIPNMSPRTIRRHLEELENRGLLLRHKEGKEVFYTKNTDYPQ